MNAGEGVDGRDLEAGPARPPANAAGQGEPDPAGAAPGSLIVRLSWAGTGLYLVVAAAATVWPGTFQAVLVVACLLLFLVGFGAFAGAYVIALARSRTEAIGMGGLYFLSGTAPPAVQRSLVGSFAVETVAAVVSASIGLVVIPADADNLLAFGVLVPLYGLGLAGLWGARHGTFAPRPASGAGRSPPPARPVAGDGEPAEGGGPA